MEALRAIVKIYLILVSLDLVKVFISQKSFGFSKSCRQRVICLSISAQVNNGLFASAVPHPSVGKATFFVLSEGADKFRVSRSSLPSSHLP